MLNGETWIVHSGVFSSGKWVLEKKPWAKTLGWFSKLQAAMESNTGWLVYGPNSAEESGLALIDSDDAENKLHLIKDGELASLGGPIVFTCKKTIVGWAGPKAMITKLKKTNANPWKWKGIQVVEVDPDVFTRVGVRGTETKTGVFRTFEVASNLAKGWMLFGKNGDVIVDEAMQEKIVEAVDLGDPNIVLSISDGVWLINTQRFTLSNIRLSPTYNLNELRDAISTCTTKYAWVSDSRDWAGWMPDQSQIDCIHVFPDQYGNMGSELFVPVEKFLELTADATTLNQYPKLVFYDKSI